MDDTRSRTAGLVLVRHGESYANVERRFQGQTDTGLTPTGRDQARQLARYLVTEYPKPSVVIGSDLGRVVATAEPYSEATGVAVRADVRLRELDTGAWSGRTFEDVACEHPREMAALRTGQDIRWGGGESFADLRKRVNRALDEHASQLASDVSSDREVVCLVFTHGGPIRVAVAHTLGLPANGHLMLSTPDNCSVTVIARRVSAREVSPAGLVRYSSTTVSAVPAGDDQPLGRRNAPCPSTTR